MLVIIMGNKNFWILLIFILSGLVLGGLLGEVAGKIEWLWWLGYGQEFGFSTPFVLDLGVLILTLGLIVKINIASIIGLILGVILYRFFVK